MRSVTYSMGVSLDGYIVGPETATEVVRRGGIGNRHVEALVLTIGRPSIAIRNETFDIPVADYWKARLYPTKSKIDRAIQSVGRIEVPELSQPYQGSGWMIAPEVIVTNRHVALTFGKRGVDSSFRFRTTPFGDPISARIDFREEEFSVEPFEVKVAQILYIAPGDDDDPTVPDIAFLRLERNGGPPLPPPIPLFQGSIAKDQIVAAIGYPARDADNPITDEMRIFGGKFEIKRLAPGHVMDKVDPATFTHDCSTLRGSSGSVVLDVESGAAAGLHFSGAFKDANYAVLASTLRETLEHGPSAGPIEVAAAPKAAVAVRERVVKVSTLEDRTGYDTGFLGDGSKGVPLPTLRPDLAAAVARRRKAAGVPDTERHLLHYEHYTVVMHAKRRMAIYTAVNIDGALTQRIKRGSDPWAMDPRIAKSYQVGNALYTDNDFDRGHLVRRIDPAWGANAAQGELDSFFFTNCTPQIHSFNDTLWGDLEDYLLDNADSKDFKASIFTGPVLGEHDPDYRGAQIPTAYWKVAVMVHAETNDLTATAYYVSQSDLITHIEFAYGQFKTYQVPVTRIEAITDLDFGALRDHDPFVPVESIAARELLRPEDIRI